MPEHLIQSVLVAFSDEKPKPQWWWVAELKGAWAAARLAQPAHRDAVAVAASAVAVAAPKSIRGKRKRVR